MYRNSLKIILTVSILIGCVPASFSAETHPAPTAATSTQVGAANWWGDTVFYEIFVRSFYDSDGNGVGDFNGITAKLDYLNDGDPQTNSDLGITGIWLMPIFPSPSYHG
ncbi:MAG TPA: alpha-amylase family glycosyl hydrolase, partial [Anaerolineales bacterium]|nr:alpha-amylase family glycosyl hydrolase [Anaerolineales bacterium]